jgi:hypothetical protein
VPPGTGFLSEFQSNQYTVILSIHALVPLYHYSFVLPRQLQTTSSPLRVTIMSESTSLHAVLKTDATAPSISALPLKIQWTGEKLDKIEGNYPKWCSRAFTNFIMLAGLYDYVFDPPLQPPQVTEPKAYKNWKDNDRLACALIAGALSDAEQDLLDQTKVAKACWLGLKGHHQNEGPVKQVTLLQNALSTKCTRSEPLTVTVKTICEAIDRAFSMGDITPNLLKCIAILNSLSGEQFTTARSMILWDISASTTAKPYTSANIHDFLETEQTLLDSDKKTATQSSIALVAKSTPPKARDIPTCTNCTGHGKHGRGHIAKYCVQPGGGMVGKPIEESKAARLLDQGKSPTMSTTPSPRTSKDGMLTLNIKDKQGHALIAYLDPKDLQVDTPTAEFAGLASTPVPTHSRLEEVEWAGWMALEEEPQTKVDWNEYSRPVEESTYTTIAPLQQTKRTAISLDTHPFYVDSGATIHISPDQSDFQMLRAIPARSVKGVGGSSIVTLGMGDICVRVARGAYIILKDALYIPHSTVRLISVSTLSITCGTAACFDDKCVKIINKSTGTFIAGGPLIPSKRLYSLTLHSAYAEHILSAQHSPDLETC